MYPTIQERDTALINWATEETAWATTLVPATNDNIRMKSSGLVNVDYAVSKHGGTVTLIANELTSGGIYITGPLAGAAAFTLYSYQCSAWTEDPEIMPMFYVGIGAATPSSAAAGDTVEDVRYLHVPQAAGASFNSLEAQGVIGCPLPFTELGGGYEDRALVFGVAWATGLNAATASSWCRARLSVRRLVASEPTTYDRRKL